MAFDVVAGSRGDHGLDKVAARRAKATFLVIFLTLGMVISLGFAAGDIIFTHDPLEPILGDHLAWVAALITSPIQVAGAVLLASKGNRESFRKDDVVVYYVMVVMFVLATVGDIASNWWGIFNAAQQRGVELGILGVTAVLIFGLIMAMFENVFQALVWAAALQYKRMRDLSSVLYEADHREEESGQRFQTAEV